MKDQALLYPSGANDECHTPDYYCSGLLPKPIMFDSLKKYGMTK